MYSEGCGSLSAGCGGETGREMKGSAGVAGVQTPERSETPRIHLKSFDLCRQGTGGVLSSGEYLREGRRAGGWGQVYGLGGFHHLLLVCLLSL